LSLFERIFGSKSKSEPSQRSDGGTSYAEYLLNGGFLASDYGFTGTSAWRLPAVYRCIAIISETIATLPINLLEVDGNTKQHALSHRNYDLFASEPNEFQTWYAFMVHLVSQALTHGNGYAKINRNDFGKIISIQSLDNSECSPYYMRNGVEHFLYYYVHGKITEKSDIIHIKCIGSDGVVGKSPIEVARDVVKGGLSQQTFTSALYDNGLNLQGALETPGKLSEPALVRLRNQFLRFKGAKNSNDTIILEEGLQYKPISIRPIDAQFVESKKFTIEDIGRMYGVPLHKLGNLDRSTNNNIEHQDLEFYKGCISAWEEQIEQEFNKKLLIRTEKRRFKHEFDNSKLLRTDLKSRSEWLNSLFTKGAVSPNEIRVIEGLNPINNTKMDDTYMQLAMSSVNNLENQNGSKEQGKAA
jgi:HK97 family phage portal protein